jgi:hypothetical protein
MSASKPPAVTTGVHQRPTAALIVAQMHEWNDTTLNPIIVTKWPRTTTLEAIDEHFRAADGWVRAVQTPWAHIFDFSLYDPSNSDAAKRRRFVEHTQRLLGTMRQEFCVAQCVVVPSTLMRGLMTAVLWWLPHVHYRPYPTLNDAVAACRAALEAERPTKSA